jgi:hypothetical protein
MERTMNAPFNPIRNRSGVEENDPTGQSRAARSVRSASNRPVLKLFNVVLAIIVPGSVALGIAWLVASKAQAVEAAPAAAADTRLPVPADAAEKGAAKLIRDVYSADFDKAKTSEQRIALAKKLISDGVDTQDDPIGRYSLFRIARDIAIDAADIDTTFHAIAEMGKRYKIDSLQARVDSLAKIGKTLKSLSDQKRLIGCSAGLAAEAIADDRYDVAKQCAALEAEAAGRASDPAMVKRVEYRAKEIAAAEAAFEKAKGAIATLQQKPDDAGANLAAGKYYCFAKGNWQRGLPMLARGDDLVLKSIAERDLAHPTDSEKQLKLADAWWDIAQIEGANARMVERSVFWSKAALPQLKGLAKARIEKRLRDRELQPVDIIDPLVEVYDVSARQIDPTELNTESLLETNPTQPAQVKQFGDDNPARAEHGDSSETPATVPALDGPGGFDVHAVGPGPKITGAGGIGIGVGGSGAAGQGFSGRGTGMRSAMLGRYGGTKASERAVAAALYWLQKHQMKDGSWSLEKYTTMCKDKSCTGVGSIESLSGATAMGLLPFLAAGQTQATKGPFQETVRQGVYWLISHQKKDGDLSADSSGKQAWMYSHAMATIALCEDYGMSHDKSVGIAAQNAINFIQAAQNTKTGGWRYHPGEEGDTSVLGWQFMALKSAQMAGLTVNRATLEGAKKWLKSCGATGAGRFSYQPDGGPTPTMSAVGVLCNQYLHAGRTDPVITGGVQLLMANQPDDANHNIYYWYYATQAMHNMADKDWEVWNRKMRTILVNSQQTEGCAAGSWDPDKPNKDAWGPYGGRVMMTSLSALTLEVYYRYLPLYKLDKPDEIKPDGPGGATSEKPITGETDPVKSGAKDK